MAATGNAIAVECMCCRYKRADKICPIARVIMGLTDVHPTAVMTLTVSMEDMELFPKDSHLNTKPQSGHIDINTFTQMHSSLDRLWWSRLVISVRGYVVNYVQHDDEVLFHTDDAFISIHRYLAEEVSDKRLGEQFVADLDAVVTYPLINEILLALSSSRQAQNPFLDNQVEASFTRVFGRPNDATYRVANGQKHAYVVFMRVLCILQERWKAERKSRKSIRFETDPEWQPDDRVVLFQEFYQGNRTWVLLDFDRYILAQWRPRGSEVIFGARFVEKKMRAGMQLCAWCGMIEQQRNQFTHFTEDKVVCSPQCWEMLQGHHGTAKPQTK
ncbi:hypothetical protein Y032_0132g1680 [Ancylostoma ceylanicum]|uniref:DUF8117 domain-containing protein n=1 Tax=Ancylostoma ceylanicum TaxID=53326 RepID=A0A016T6N0_9BILA|nr:hypothetical protein Y032_0132g1680 [Ancylostoma ceylanicum]